jgi:hypothetical protein
MDRESCSIYIELWLILQLTMIHQFDFKIYPHQSKLQQWYKLLVEKNILIHSPNNERGHASKEELILRHVQDRNHTLPPNISAPLFSVFQIAHATKF